MNYIDLICDGCGRAFTEQDDIVVCPQCGTPQHRECYMKNAECVNAGKHGESFEWSAPEKKEKEPEPESKEPELIPCPSCRHKNPADARQCEACGLKLIVLGINLARENMKKEQQSLPAERPPQDNSQPLSPTEALRIKNAFSSRFIVTNAPRYLQKFSRIENGGMSFNRAAFFFCPYWFFYRKLYKAGIIFATLFLMLSIAFVNVSLELSSLMEYFFQNYEAMMTDTALAERFYSEYARLMPYISAQFFSELALRIICGLSADRLYKSYVDASAIRIGTAGPKQAVALMTALSGTSVIAVCLSYCVIFMASQLVGMLIL